MNLLLTAAAVSLCLAVAMWIALVLARWLRHRLMVRRGRRRPAAGLLWRNSAQTAMPSTGRQARPPAAEDVIAVAGGLAVPVPHDRAAVGAALAGRGGAAISGALPWPTRTGASYCDCWARSAGAMRHRPAAA
jgi:hypothetical protein